jgi:hypothetical protein
MGEPCVPVPWSLDQETIPAAFIERRIDGNNVNLSFWETLSYKIAARRFPTAQSCLTGNSRSDFGYDLTKVNWRALSSDAKAMTCLFRINSAIGDIETSATWFQSTGFKTRIKRYPVGHYRAGGATLFFTWIRKDGGAKSPFGWSENWPPKSISYGTNGAVDWDANGSVAHVNISYNIL